MVLGWNVCVLVYVHRSEVQFKGARMGLTFRSPFAVFSWGEVQFNVVGLGAIFSFTSTLAFPCLYGQRREAVVVLWVVNGVGTFMFPNRKTRFMNVNGSLCSGGSLTGSLFRGTGSVLKFHVASVVFGKASRRLGRAGIARPTMFLRSIVSTLYVNRGFAPSVMTKRSLNRFSTLITTNTLGFRSNLGLICTHTVTVRGTYRTTPSAVTTVIKLSSAAVRGVYDRIDATSGIIIPTGCGYPKRLIVDNGMRTIRITYSGLGRTNTGHTLMLPINNTFRSPLVRPTGSRLRTTVRAAAFGAPQYTICRGMSTRTRAIPRRVGTGLVTRLATSMH